MSLVDNIKLARNEGKIGLCHSFIILPSGRPGLLELMSCNIVQLFTEQDLPSTAQVRQAWPQHGTHKLAAVLLQAEAGP